MGGPDLEHFGNSNRLLVPVGSNRFCDRLRFVRADKSLLGVQNAPELHSECLEHETQRHRKHDREEQHLVFDFFHPIVFGKYHLLEFSLFAGVLRAFFLCDKPVVLVRFLEFAQALDCALGNIYFG